MKLITKPDDPFDYLLGLKKGGFQRTHGEEFDPSLLSKSGPIIGLASVEDREIDIARQIREVVESNIVIPKDMYIDDGDMPTAQNFYQWITEDRFGAIGEERPFMEQLIWATIAFNDACHVCSDKEWLYHTHKVDDTYAKFERKVALFEFGRCPHCGTTRADQINKGQMKYINELAVNAGQRCVVANTPVLTEHGVFRIVDTLPQNLAYGFTPFSLNVHNGTEIEATSFAFKAKPEPIYKVTFSNGCWIAGTKDHPILTKDGFVTLGDITIDTPVDFQYGMRQFGNVELPKYEAREYGINFSHGDVPPRLRLGNAAVYEEFLRGLFLSNGRRAFPNMDVLNDVSAMLFNVGVPHRIEAPSIVLSPEQYDLLHGGVFDRGFVTETVASVKIDGSAETFDYTLPSSHRFVTGGVISHNSGKSQTVGGFLSPYLTHRMLKLQKPAAYYGLTRNTVLHGTFVALTYVQAKDTLWTPFYGAISESKWFREYHALMRHYENKYGESLLKFNDTFVMYRHRGLTCLVGDTLVDTKRGLVQLKDVQVGDYVKGLRGEYHKVSAFYNNGKKETFRVTLASNHSVVGTADHLLLSKVCDTDEQVWVELGDLVPGDFIAVNAENHHSGIDNTDGIVWEPVKSVEKSCVETVYDITVDHHTHLFTANGIIVHNCYPAGPDRRILRGRCLRASTILNTNGGFFHASELIKRKGYREVSGLEIDSHKGRVKVSHTYKDRSETIRIETRNGYSVEGTPEHPMLVIKPDLSFKWVPLDEMNVGDWIVSTTKKNDPMFGNNTAVSKDMATIMGYYVANGHRHEISSSDDAVINNLYRKYKNVTNGHLPTWTRHDTNVRSHNHYLGLGGTGRFVRDYLNPLGVKSTNAKDKDIPLSIRTAPFEVLHEFLEAYFECDSGINGGACGNSLYNAPAEIEVGSASRKLAHQLHILLLHAYGIVGRLRKRTFHDKLDKRTGIYNAKREQWIIAVTGYDAMRFLNTFKRAKVQKYRTRFKNLPAGYCSDRRSIPYVRRYVYDTYENARLQDTSGKKLTRYVREDGTIYSTKNLGFAKPKFLKHYRPSGPNSNIDAPIAEFLVYDDENWGRVLPILDQFSSDRAKRIRNLLKQGAHFEEVVNIREKAKKVNVYDVTVPGTHAFTANGLTSHNTRYLASCDEIAYFDSNKDSAKVKVNAHEIYDALTNSLYTLRAAAERLVRHGYEDVFSGYSMNVTSPVAKNDMIHVLGKRADESDSMYYVHRPTWEVNPDFPRNSKLITEAYRKDPESADKNFGANPPLIANPFLANHKMIRDLEDFDRKNAMRVRPVMKNSIKAGQGYMYGELDKIKRRKQASMCAIDAGSTDNSFSIAMGHRDGLNLVVDIVSEVIPLPGFRINHSLTYSELILPVMEARNVRVLLADRWNSIKLLDDAAIDRGDPESEEPTFIAKQYSLKYRDLVSVRTCIEQGIVRLPKSEIPVKTLLDVQDSDYRDFYAGKPVAHLFKQLFTIKDLEKSVGKGDGYTDDTWRAVALLVWGLLEEEFAGFLEAAPDEIVTVRPSAIAASKLYSGGGGSVGNGGGSLTTINGAPLAMIGRGKR